MKYLLGLGVGLAIVVGCKSPRATPGDAVIEPDVAVDMSPAMADASPDIAIDAPPDAPPDVPPDAPSPSPRCLTAPTIVLDVSPLRILLFARSGTTLYISAYDEAQVAPSKLFTFDMTTNTQSAAPMVTSGPLILGQTETGGDVFGSDGADDGTIWQLHPGAAPSALIQHRFSPRLVTSDGTTLYWSERTTATGPQDQIVKRPIAGGSIEPLMTCDTPTALRVAGGYVYCVSSVTVKRRRADGFGAEEFVVYPSSYPIFATMTEGNGFFFLPISFTGLIFRVDNTSAMAATAAAAGGSRMASLTASDDYYYTVDLGFAVRRTHRATGVQEVAYAHDPTRPIANQTAVVWNNQLYVDAQDYQLGGAPYLMHCVD